MHRVSSSRGARILRSEGLPRVRAWILWFVLFWPFPERLVHGAILLWVSEDRYFTIWAFDASGRAAGGFSAPRQVLRSTLPRGRSGLAAAPGELYYTHSTSGRIWVLDPGEGRHLRSFPKPRHDISGLAAGVGALYAVSASARGGTVYRLDSLDGEVLSALAVPGGREAIAFSPSRGSLFVKVGSLEIAEIDAATGDRRGSVEPPGGVSGLGYDEALGVLEVLLPDGRLQRLDPGTGGLLAEVTLRDSLGNLLVETGGVAVQEGPDLPGRDRVLAPGVGAVFKVQELAIPARGAVAVPVLLSSDLPVEAFLVSLLCDPGALFLDGISVEETVTSEVGADFVSIERFPNGGNAGVVLDLLPPFPGNMIPAGENQPVVRYVFRCVETDLTGELATELRLSSGVLGEPQKENLVVAGGVAQEVRVEPGTLVCEPLPQVPGGPRFHCGGPAGEDGLPVALAAAPGEAAEMSLYYTFPAPEGDLVQGLSMALAVDCRLRCLEESFRIPPESITAQVGADFVDFQCESDPDDGDGCELVLGLLVDTEPPFTATPLPATVTPLLVGRVTLEVSREVPAGDCLEVRFQDGVQGRGNVPIANVVVVDNRSVPAGLAPCELCSVSPLPALLCGAGALGPDGLPLEPQGSPGDVVNLWFWYRSPAEEVFALTEALRFACDLECLPETFAPAPERSELAAAEFVDFRCESTQEDGDPCEMVLEVVLGPAGDPAAPALPAASDPGRIARVALRIRPEARRGACLPVEYQDGIDGAREGTFSNSVTLAGGAVSPQTRGSRVCVVPAEPPAFFCGGAGLGPDGRPAPPPRSRPGESVEVCFWYTSPVDERTREDEVQALSMVLCYDCGLGCLEDSFRLPEDSIARIMGAEFVDFQCDNDPADGDGCEIVLAVLVDFVPPFDGRTLPPTDTPLKIGCVDVEISTMAKLGACFFVEFCDGADGRGDVPIRNVVTTESKSTSPETWPCEVCVEFLGPEFLCGAGEPGTDGNPGAAGGKAGEAAEVCFWYRVPEDGARDPEQLDHLQGLSMALEYDCRLECREDSFRIPEDSIAAALGVEFADFQCDGDPHDGDGCEIVLAMLVDVDPPFDGRTLPPTEVPLKLACADFGLPAGAACRDCFDLEFRDGVNGRGRVPIRNLVVAANRSFLARTRDCQACVTRVEEPVFVRGDCNFDGEVNVADAAEVVSALFGEGTWQPIPPCLDACDANDDGRFDLADATAILYYLFRFGRVPPDPGPEAPGPDPTEDKLSCDTSACE